MIDFILALMGFIIVFYVCFVVLFLYYIFLGSMLIVFPAMAVAAVAVRKPVKSAKVFFWLLRGTLYLGNIVLFKDIKLQHAEALLLEGPLWDMVVELSSIFPNGGKFLLCYQDAISKLCDFDVSFSLRVTVVVHLLFFIGLKSLKIAMDTFMKVLVVAAASSFLAASVVVLGHEQWVVRRLARLNKYSPMTLYAWIKVLDSAFADLDVFKNTRFFDKTWRAMAALRLLHLGYVTGFLALKHEDIAMKKGHTLRGLLMRVTKFINEVNLPSFIRSNANSRLSHQETFELLKELGYPMDDIILQDPKRGISGGVYDNEWLISGSNWQIHMPHLKGFVPAEFKGIIDASAEFRHTYTYSNLDNQLRATARYFEGLDVKVDVTDQDLEQIWNIVKPIYANSRLTPIYAIMKAWNMKFNVGVFATSAKKDKYGGFKKMSRREYRSRYDSVQDFLVQWEDFFKHFPRMKNMAQFFTKAEHLPPRKWMADKVRTPVASMLPQYISQMVFSAEPNHRFQYEATPVKVGMPINGATLSAMFNKHNAFDKHYCGDCTAFDSTLTGPILEVIKAVRKKGFASHKEFGAIAWLIDRNYEEIEHGLLVSSNSGNIYGKHSGLMTGHASTSADNSLGMVALYMLAWRKITGQDAQAFRFYNELSVYGDDHILSVRKGAPANWTWSNITSKMAEWNVIMREEVPSGGKGVKIEQCIFLSKCVRKATSIDREEMKRAEIPCPGLVVYHDPDKLKKKLVAPLTNQNPLYRAKRIISYMYLAAHNKEAYILCSTGLNTIFRVYPGVKAELCKTVPTYDRVLRVFYTTKNNIIEADDELGHAAKEGGEDLGAFITYGQLTHFDALMNTLSVIPDFLNPQIYNAGYITAVQEVAHEFFEWPRRLLATANQCRTQASLISAMRGSPYAFLGNQELPCWNPKNTYGFDLIRHWLFLYLARKRSTTFFRILDLLDSKITNLNFIISGRVPERIAHMSLNLYENFLVLTLGALPIPKSFGTLVCFFRLDALKFPTIGEELTRYFAWCWRLVISYTPPAYTDLISIFRQTKPYNILITAPTGTGKSTTMVNFVRLHATKHFKKTVVILPRSVLVRTVVPYMISSFGEYFTGATTGMLLDPRKEVWYITAQEYLLRPDTFDNPDFLYIVDEAHVEELAYRVIQQELRRLQRSMLFVTATPSARLMMTPLSFNIPLISPWKIDVVIGTSRAGNADSFPKGFHIILSGLAMTSGLTADSKAYRVKNGEPRKFHHSGPEDTFFTYFGACRMAMNSRGIGKKFLIFVDSMKEGEACLNYFNGRGFFIHSKSSENIDLTADYFVSTSVADAGLTIPNVQFVASKTTRPRRDIVQRASAPLITDPSGAMRTLPLRCYHGPEIILQRKGRTGRTNDGMFFLWEGLNDTEEEGPLNEMETMVEWTSQGLPGTTLLLNGFVSMRSFLGMDIPDFELQNFDFVLKHLFKAPSFMAEQEARLTEPSFGGDFANFAPASKGAFIYTFPARGFSVLWQLVRVFQIYGTLGQYVAALDQLNLEAGTPEKARELIFLRWFEHSRWTVEAEAQVLLNYLFGMA